MSSLLNGAAHNDTDTSDHQDAANFNLSEITMTVNQIKELQRVNDPSIYCYYLLFGIGSCGNFYALKDLVKARQLSQYINVLMAHLTFADLCVVFISLPIEIMWSITVSWDAGDVSCRSLQSFRLFGMYLSSNIVVCISIDRLHAFAQSTKFDYNEHKRKFLLAAYIIALLLSIPQAIIYRVETHPLIPGYAQCIQAAWFVNTVLQKFYIFMCLLGMYFGPLIAIVYCYFKIFFHLHFDGQSIEIQETVSGCQCRVVMDCNEDSFIETRTKVTRFSIIRTAKRRTLKMTLIIVIAYLVCWSPYACLIMYFSFDFESAQYIDPVIQQGTMVFAVAHSCVNPFVYRINLVRRLPSKD